ncbi:MAG: riboflavin biosynthesis protein RibF [Elusimicrobia bacterium]|nr:riboflavin biosynthesis protein RibF [Candidatus Obscuribacterium magneticum]
MKKGRLITIGSFDGLHRGHAALVDRAVLEARKRGLRPAALTFSIPPRMVLETPGNYYLLSTLLEKECLLQSRGIDDVIFLPFDKQLSQVRPFEFFRRVLIDVYQAKGLVVGLDFRFGQRRGAGARELVQWGCEYDLPVWVISPVRYSGKIVSSTLIRQFIMMENHFKAATNFLGHPYLVAGRVVKGRGVGKEMGIPTANIDVEKGKVLPRGVFIIQAWVEGNTARQKLVDDYRQKGRSHKGICNIGVRPTFLKRSPLTMEIHLFDRDLSLMGKRVAIELLHKIRDERRFPSKEALIQVISRDELKARRFFKSVRIAPLHVPSKSL